MNSTQMVAGSLGAFSCGTCMLVIGAQNPVHSILLLMSVFFLGTLLLFFLQSEYFASLFLIVYVGAIVVLFLFMMSSLELKSVHISSRFRDLFSYRHLILGLLFFEVLLLVSQNFFDLHYFFSLMKNKESTSFLVESNSYFDWSKMIQRTDHLRSFGGLLYTEYKSSILIASVLLFLSSVGALALSLSLSADSIAKGRFFMNSVSMIKSQDANYQSMRHPGLLLNAFRSLKQIFYFTFI